MKNLVLIVDKLLSFIPAKTVVGGAVSLLTLAWMNIAPGVPFESLLETLNSIGNLLFTAGIVNWRLSDYLKQWGLK